MASAMSGMGKRGFSVAAAGGPIAICIHTMNFGVFCGRCRVIRGEVGGQGCCSSETLDAGW